MAFSVSSLSLLSFSTLLILSEKKLASLPESEKSLLVSKLAMAKMVAKIAPWQGSIFATIRSHSGPPRWQNDPCILAAAKILLLKQVIALDRLH
jgi:hypothetical protein